MKKKLTMSLIFTCGAFILHAKYLWLRYRSATRLCQMLMFSASIQRNLSISRWISSFH